MAGEYLTAGKLFKRGYQVAVTTGNAKAIDLFVHVPKTNKTYNVQVKALRGHNCFPIKREAIHADHVYVFIVLKVNEPDEDYFVLLGQTILDDINRFFGSSYKREKPSPMPAIDYGSLKEFKDKWELFDQ
jgi:hypothetical protein